MGEEFYAIIKLVSGEEIFSLIMVDDEQENPIIIMQNPVLIKMLQSPHGSFIKVKPMFFVLLFGTLRPESFIK